MAAVLACGEGAVVSHRSAAALWGLLPTRSAVVDVSIPGTGGRVGRAGIRLHRARTLTPDATTRRHGLPVTTPHRSIADLRRTLGRRDGISSEELRRAIRQAGVLGLPLGMEAIPDGTRSELERLFLRLCRQHGLPLPEVNAKVESLEVDFLWRNRRLIVETDGYRYHRGRAAFEKDRERDLRLRTLGYDVIRVSYRQVVGWPDEVVTVLRASLL